MSMLARAGRGVFLAFTLCLVAPVPSIAQDDFGAAPTEESEGKPLFGYLACGAGCIAIIFVLCISARR